MRILVIIDDEASFLRIQNLFTEAFPKKRHDFKWISTANLEEIATNLEACDLCLIDDMLQGAAGHSLIRAIDAHELPIPVILLTEESEESIEETIADYGISDFLIKSDITPKLLRRSIRYSLAHKHQQRTLTNLAYTDGLTGVANRLKFDHTLELLVQTSARANSYLALIIVDLDDFKMINDTYGHPAGDLLLQELSARFTALVRQSDMVARLGGDEFGIIINGYRNQSDIQMLADKILSAFDKPIKYGSETFFGKGSLGVAILAPDDQPREANALLRAADGALYRAKNKGKNTVVYYDQRLGESIQKSACMENALSNAIKNDELELFFQPKFSSAELTLVGTEVLLRWNWSIKDNITPDVFIPIAERSGTIVEIGLWVIEETCKKMRLWAREGLATVPVAINVSPLQLLSSTFVERVTHILNLYHIDPRLMEFEITETALMEHLDQITDRMQMLANIGCTWVVDDFGTGHSSLSRLTQLPIAKIKMDQSFVKQAPTSETNQRICCIISLLAYELDLKLVVEGVETLAHINALSMLPHQELQGYYFSKPLPETDYTYWLDPEVASRCVDPWLAAATTAAPQFQKMKRH